MGVLSMETLKLYGSLRDVFEGAELIKGTQLPMVEFKIGKTKYGITDLRYLNSNARDIIAACVLSAIEGETDHCTFNISEGLLEDGELKVLCDILLGIKFKFYKGGRNGFCGTGAFLIGEVSYTIEDGKIELRCELFKEHAEKLQRSFSGAEKVNFFDAVMAIAEMMIKHE